MAIKKSSINGQGGQTDYKHLVSNYNTSSVNNPSHNSGVPTNYDIKTITLEDCDRAMYEEFNKRFVVGEKIMPLILLDTETASLQFQNAEQFDLDKGFLNGPFFTIYRSKSMPKLRTSPTFKKAIYTVPKQKANGIVYEEWITEGPLNYDLIYELKFITSYREYINVFEEQMRHYFRNKRNIIICNNERFSVGPEDQNTLASLDIINLESVEERTLYALSFVLKLECFTRDMSTVQKREKPNKFTINISVRDDKNNVVEKDSTIEINADKLSVNLNPWPFEHEPNGEIHNPPYENEIIPTTIISFDNSFDNSFG